MRLLNTKIIKYLVLAALIGTLEYKTQMHVSITDGDTVKIGRSRIRLDGLDAPETSQFCRCSGQDIPCGLQSTQFLYDTVGDNDLECRARGRDMYGRYIAVCFAKNGTELVNLNALMVSEGYAFPYLSHEFDAENRDAKKHKKGLFSCKIEKPQLYRRRQKLPKPKTPAKKRHSAPASPSASAGT